MSLSMHFWRVEKEKTPGLALINNRVARSSVGKLYINNNLINNLNLIYISEINSVKKKIFKMIEQAAMSSLKQNQNKFIIQL